MGDGKNPVATAHAKGYYTGLYMVLFMPIGIALWLVTGNPGLTGAGVAVGVAIGASVERASGPVYLSPGEIRRRQRLVALIVVLGFASLVVGFWALTTFL